MIDVGDMVAELIDAGCSPAVAAAVVARAFVAGVSSSNSTGIPPDSAAEKRRAWDRERKRKSTGIPPDSTGIPESPSISLDNKKEKKDKDRGSQLPDGWKPDEVRWIAACRKLGPDGAGRELQKFTSHHRAKGTVFKNWSFAWDKWLLNSEQWAPKQVAGVGVVNPETVNWRAALQSYKNFGNWPKGHGNDPSSPACRAPPELLREYGFEPVIPALRAM
jgi:hypothetical protein